MEEYVREPCPWRIVDDCGGAFTMGIIGGGVFQSIKGFRNAPVGMKHRLRGSVNAVKIRAPQIGGGPLAMVGSALMGGILLALIEGVGILLTRYTAQQFQNRPAAEPRRSADIARESYRRPLQPIRLEKSQAMYLTDAGERLRLKRLYGGRFGDRFYRWNMGFA
ncbi:mitochondrial import inner membrane translocase subunit Tim17-B isoform X3 [Rhinoderma darwinii]|uniref:mitochondrial import inner membrane translocase subunit Tim17-B isoform X3 n=1 Tax=Rhinoderma darwinii TaxID=43563 RepID=UPI003F6671BD